MANTIEMGNDELILYIRRHHPACETTNPRLGKAIWAWIRDHDPNAEKLAEGVPCLWGADGSFVDDTKLPTKATHLQFDRAILPALFDRLDELGSG